MSGSWARDGQGVPTAQNGDQINSARIGGVATPAPIATSTASLQSMSLGSGGPGEHNRSSFDESPSTAGGADVSSDWTLVRGDGAGLLDADSDGAEVLRSTGTVGSAAQPAIANAAASMTTVRRIGRRCSRSSTKHPSSR